jgi:hypothetical protein
MIDILGYYETKDGRFVKIVKIYQNQDIAEGFLDGRMYVWHKDGVADRNKERPRDIIGFLGANWDEVYSDQY